MREVNEHVAICKLGKVMGRPTVVEIIMGEAEESTLATCDAVTR
jgi:hypothetical protein